MGIWEHWIDETPIRVVEHIIWTRERLDISLPHPAFQIWTSYSGTPRQVQRGPSFPWKVQGDLAPPKFLLNQTSLDTNLQISSYSFQPTPLFGPREFPASCPPWSPNFSSQAFSTWHSRPAPVWLPYACQGFPPTSGMALGLGWGPPSKLHQVIW